MAYSHDQPSKIEHGHATDGRTLPRLPALPDRNRRGALLDQRLDHGHVLLARQRADLAALQYLLRRPGGGPDLGSAQPLEELLPAKRIAAAAPAQFAANFRQCRITGALFDRDEGRIYLASLFIQFPALALCRATFFALLCSRNPDARNFSPGRENAPGWPKSASGPTTRLASPKKRDRPAHGRFDLR